jgi:hypothetical protein
MSIVYPVVNDGGAVEGDRCNGVSGFLDVELAEDGLFAGGGAGVEEGGGPTIKADSSKAVLIVLSRLGVPYPTTPAPALTTPPTPFRIAPPTPARADVRL